MVDLYSETGCHGRVARAYFTSRRQKDALQNDQATQRSGYTALLRRNISSEWEGSPVATDMTISPPRPTSLPRGLLIGN
jgi:hypothetical protein